MSRLIIEDRNNIGMTRKGRVDYVVDDYLFG